MFTSLKTLQVLESYIKRCHLGIYIRDLKIPLTISVSKNI